MRANPSRPTNHRKRCQRQSNDDAARSKRRSRLRPTGADERLWSGGTTEEKGIPVSQLKPWLDKRRGRRFAQLGAPVPDAPSSPEIAVELRAALDRIRRIKDDVELAR